MNLVLDKKVLQKRVFKKELLNLHAREFMLGQTRRYLSLNKNTIDVGAATGMYTAFFAKFSKKVISFEAVPPVFEQLTLVANANKNVEVHNLAVANFNGDAEFYVDDKRLSNSGFQNLVDGQKIIVETIKLDDFQFDNVGFIKIDVEGNELDVLYGAEETINEFKPTCMVEITKEFNKYPIKTTFSYFFEKKYQCFYNVRDVGLKKLENIDDAIEIARYVNITDGDFLFTITPED